MKICWTLQVNFHFIYCSFQLQNLYLILFYISVSLLIFSILWDILLILQFFKTFFLFLIFVLFCFLGPYLWRMKVPRVGVELELQLLAYAIAIAMPDMSCVCGLHHSAQQLQILNHWGRPGIEPTSSWILVRFVTAEPQWELPHTLIL